jgi:hypothetical protein
MLTGAERSFHATILVCVPPTVGHVNHGIALANLAGRHGLHAVLVTGLAAADYLSTLPPGTVRAVTTASYDLNTRRSDPRRKPHLEQVCEPDQLRSAAAATAAAVQEHGARLIVGKDAPSAVLVAAAAGISYVGYLTDGAESLVPSLNRQVSTDPGRLAAQIGLVATELGVPEAAGRPAHEFGISPELNIVRGLPETFHGPDELLRPLAARVAFAGALTFDGPATLISEWEQRLADLPRPVTYVTFGTVLKDTRRFRIVAAAANAADGTLVVGSDVAVDSGASFGAGAIVARYIPNQAALRVADVIVHHGGHGTMLSALAHGVPQVVIPDNDRTNQAYHGEVLQRLGIGRLLGDDCTPQQLRTALAELREPAARLAARQFAQRVRDRTAELGAELGARLTKLALG